MATILDNYSAKGIEAYRAVTNTEEIFLMVCLDWSNYSDLYRFKAHGFIKDFQYVTSDIRVFTSKFNSMIERSKERITKKIIGPEYMFKTGICHVELNSGKIVTVVCWFAQGGNKESFKGVTIGTREAIEELKNCERKVYIKQVKPKPGIYHLTSVNNFGRNVLQYEKFDPKKLPNGKVFHPKTEEIMRHIEYYFANVKLFMKNNRAGRKTSLCYGSTGTGKTTIALKVAMQYREKYCVIFTTSMADVYQHVDLCAKYKVPTLVVYEDCESWLKENDARVKNFLSGIDRKPNPAGCYILLTTNYPNQIEKTILTRKGRIDRIFHIGKITGTWLIDCVKFYFGPYVKTESMDELLMQFENGTYAGSEVETMVDECLTIAAADGRDHILPADVNTVIKTFKEEFEKLKDTMNDLNEEEFSKSAAASVGYRLNNSGA